MKVCNWYPLEANGVMYRYGFMCSSESLESQRELREVENWCKEQFEDDVVMLLNYSDTRICFRREQDALLFKLTWM